jgi:chitinase
VKLPRACWLVLAAALLASGATAELGGAVAQSKDAERVFVGYVFGRPRHINFSLYTHLFHAFAVPDAEGNIRKDENVPSRALAAQAHKSSVKVVLSLGGWGWDKEFASIVAKPAAEARYVNTVITSVDESDYDGIDLDWEYPDNEREIVGFERLVRTFRKRLDSLGARKARPMVLTMAASSDPGTLRWLDRKLLLETMDWINVMTYDFAGPWTTFAGHHSPLFASSRQPGGRPRSTADTMKYLVEERGLPPSRLAVGVPLYGRGFAVSKPYASTKDSAKATIPRGNYSNLHRLIHEQGWTRQWDAETQSSWLIAPDRKIVIGYDDAESVALKTEWTMKQGFRGIFFWQIAGDLLPDGTNPLQEAARRRWAARVGAAN